MNCLLLTFLIDMSLDLHYVLIGLVFEKTISFDIAPFCLSFYFCFHQNQVLRNSFCCILFSPLTYQPYYYRFVFWVPSHKPFSTIQHQSLALRALPRTTLYRNNELLSFPLGHLRIAKGSDCILTPLCSLTHRRCRDLPIHGLLGLPL